MLFNHLIISSMTSLILFNYLIISNKITIIFKVKGARVVKYTWPDYNLILIHWKNYILVVTYKVSKEC